MIMVLLEATTKKLLQGEKLESIIKIGVFEEEHDWLAELFSDFLKNFLIFSSILLFPFFQKFTHKFLCFQQWLILVRLFNIVS